MPVLFHTKRWFLGCSLTWKKKKETRNRIGNGISPSWFSPARFENKGLETFFSLIFRPKGDPYLNATQDLWIALHGSDGMFIWYASFQSSGSVEHAEKLDFIQCMPLFFWPTVVVRVYLPFCWVVICPENAEMFFFEVISPPLSHTVALTLCNVAYR